MADFNAKIGRELYLKKVAGKHTIHDITYVVMKMETY
jgi:hypothetical protein